MTQNFTIRKAGPGDDAQHAALLAPTYGTDAAGLAAEAGIAEIASDARIDDMTGTAFHTAHGFAEAERVACFVRKVGR